MLISLPSCETLSSDNPSISCLSGLFSSVGVGSPAPPERWSSSAKESNRVFSRQQLFNIGRDGLRRRGGRVALDNAALLIHKKFRCFGKGTGELGLVIKGEFCGGRFVIGCVLTKVPLDALEPLFGLGLGVRVFICGALGD
jgi:hypothetical protein